MDIATIAATIFPIVTLVIGHTLASRNDRAKDERAIERERVARAEERRDRVMTRRAEFQRNTLIELQDTAIAFARATGALHHADLMAYRTTGDQWGRQMLPDDLSERHASLSRQIDILKARIGPGAVQVRAAALQTICSNSAGARSEGEAVTILAGQRKRRTSS
jgi:hypothetical protein